jgi:hypothetical protein
MTEPNVAAEVVAPGEYLPAGEAAGEGRTFSLPEVARAFAVEPDRVRRAFAGEFRLGDGGRIDSRQAQHLAELMLTDEPLAEREAALMRLGAFTPRPDQMWGVGETAPGEESDRYVADPTVPEDDLAARDASHDPSQPSR